MLDLEKGGRQSTVLCSIRKHRDTEKCVGYLRLRALAGYRPHTSFTAVKINNNNTYILLYDM